MLPRVLFVWLSFSVMLLALALYSQGEPFEFQHVLLSLAFSLPVALAVLRGGLGDASSNQLQYPSLTLMIVSAWILSVGPSLVVESHAARFLYHYSPIALSLARMFFFLWCVVFTFACGRPQLRELHPRPGMSDFLACFTFAAVVASYLVRTGTFSFYQTSRYKYGLEAGSTESLAQVAGLPLFTLLPPLFFLILTRMQARTSRYIIVAAGFVASWGLLFLLGSRTSLASAVACCLLLCRGLGLRMRANVVLSLGVALPALLALILVYRNALSSSESEATSVSHYISIATDATSTLNDEQGQDDAVDLVSNNMRVRLWYGQQFCVVVDQWLEEGANMRGSLISGVVASLPTVLFSGKNAIADDLNLEKLLSDSQRFPAIDLAPTPWMQWLYELGVVGLLIGTLLYAWIVRVTEIRLNHTKSFYEVLFWLEIFVSMLAPEHTTDWLVLVARNVIVDAIVVATLAKILAWFSDLGRRETQLA